MKNLIGLLYTHKLGLLETPTSLLIYYLLKSLQIYQLHADNNTAISDLEATDPG